MSINAKGKAFYCDYGTSVVAVRCGSDHAVVEEFNLNDSGKFRIKGNVHNLRLANPTHKYRIIGRECHPWCEIKEMEK